MELATCRNIMVVNIMLMLLVHVGQPLPASPGYRFSLGEPPHHPPHPPLDRPITHLVPPPRPPNANNPPSSPKDRFSAVNDRICHESCSAKFILSWKARFQPSISCHDECTRKCDTLIPPNLYQCTAGCTYNFITSPIIQ